MPFSTFSFMALLGLCCLISDYSSCQAFSMSKACRNHRGGALLSQIQTPCGDGVASATPSNDIAISRRSLFQSIALIIMTSAVASLENPTAAMAATRVPLEKSLYNILRVREATQQESRLIKSGKFKDVQRANVKLAVKFMIENYSLNDSFLAATTYLDGNDRRMAAVNVGQSAVQDLYTILEYFDASDVQNLKIGSSTLSSEKEGVVLKGLDATRRSIDDFLTYFPKDMVDSIKNKVKEENDLNFKEFDRSLGDIVNPNPTV